MKRKKIILLGTIGVVAAVFLFFVGRAIIKNNMEETKKIIHTGKGEAYFNGTIIEENEDYWIVKADGKYDSFKKDLEIEVTKDITGKDGASSSFEKGEKLRIVFNKASIVELDNAYKINIVFAIYRLSEIE